MKGEYLNFDQRKIINSCLSQNKKLCEIAALLDMVLLLFQKKLKEIEFTIKVERKKCGLNTTFLERNIK